MNGKSNDHAAAAESPVWARSKAFPPAPEGYGWIDQRGISHPCESLSELSEKIRNDSSSAVLLVWSPDSDFCQVPEEVPALAEPIGEIRKRWIHEDLAQAKNRILWIGIGTFLLISYVAFHHWVSLNRIEISNGLDLSLIEKITWLVPQLAQSTAVAIALLCFLLFAFIPWYQAQKRQKEIRLHGSDTTATVPVIRFETWLGLQRAPVTKLILGAISLAFLAQIYGDLSILGFSDSIHQAGLVKAAYRDGEFWRLLTAPMLHGGLVHFIMNALALLYLGKRMEVFARWPHLSMVFFFSAMLAGEASARLTSATSVGASGGLMGWLGFLLVFETLHHRLVPRSSRRRLLGGVILTAVIGLIGYRFIDNAAHLGGLLAGMIYAAIVFPKSSSVSRPNMNLTDRIIGSVCLAIIFYSSGLAAVKILP